MRIRVKARTRASKEAVEQLTSPLTDLFGTIPDMPTYRVSVKEAPVDGRANDAIIRALAKHFDTAPSLIALVSGHTAKQKVFEIG